MGKTCKFVYLDRHGNESTVYEQNLHLGAEVAEQAYLESMQDLAKMKFSVDPDNITGNWDDFIAFGTTSIEAAGDGDFYKVKGKDTKRVSGILNSLHDEFNMQKIASKMAFDREVKKNEERLGKGEVGNFLTQTYDIKLQPSGVFSGNEKFDALINLVKEEFKFKQEAGTEIHEVLENFINLRNEHKGKKEYTIDRLARLATSHIDDTGVQTSHMELVRSINTLFKDMFPGKDLSQFQFETEVAVWDEEMDVAGTIDLLIRDEKGMLHIFDYKTKEKGKLQWWSSTGLGTLNTPGMTLHDNKSNMAALQTSLYKEILQRKGFKVAPPKVIYVDADVKAKDETQPRTADNLQYHNFGTPRIMNVFDTRKAWVNIAQKTNLFGRKIDLDDTYRYEKEVGKLNTANDIVSEITDGEALASNIDYDRTAKNILRNKILVNPKTKREGFKAPSDVVIDFKTSTDAERIKEITTVYKQHFVDKAETISNVFKIFNGEKVKKNDIIKGQINSALLNFNKDTHELQHMNALPGLSDVEDTFLVATDKNTGVKSVIIIDNENNNKIRFKKKGNRTSILGKYLVDSMAEDKYGVQQVLMESTVGNYKMISAGIAMMRLKEIDPTLQVDSIRYAQILTTSSKDKTYDPKTLGMQAIVPNVHAIMDQLKDKDSISQLNTNLSKTFSSPDVASPLSYNEDYLTTLYGIINKHSDLGDVSGYKRYIRDYQNSSLAKDELIDQLHRYQGSLKDRLLGTSDESKKANSRDALAINKEYRVLSKAILQLSNVDFFLGRNPEKLIADKGARTHSRIKHSMIQALHSKRSDAEAKAVHEFHEFKKQHNKILHDFLEENNTSILGTIGKRSYLSVYRVLFANPTDDVLSPDTIMTLKSPADLRAENKPAAAKYAEFFNKQVYKGFSLIMTKGEFDDFTEVESWQEGRIPLMAETAHSQLSSISDPKEYMKVLKDRFLQGGKKQNNSAEDIKDYLKSKTILQKTNQGWYDALGINEEGEIRRPDLKHEKNLEAVLDSFMIDNLRQKHMNGVLGVFRSMNAVLAAAEVYDKYKTQEARIFLDEMVQGQIHGEMNDDGALGKWVDVLNDVATYTQIGFSAKQAIVELTTNLVGSTNTMIANTLKSLFGGKSRFSPADWAAAGAILVGKNMGMAKKVVPMLHNLGMVSNDIEQLYGDDYKKTQGNVVLTSKWAFWINSAAIREFRNQIFVAEAMKDGVLDAYTYDADKDDSIYDQYKDKRFFGPGGSQSPEQLALYKGHLAVAKEEGTLSENGGLTRPYSFSEIQSKRDYYKDIYGSMSKEGKSNASNAAFGRLFLKFKHWALAKKDFYYSPRLPSDTKKGWVKTPDPTDPSKYIMEWKGLEHEGVWQTLVALRNHVYGMMGRDGYEAKPLDDLQQDNLAKAGTDMMVASIMLYVLSGLFDDEEFFKTELGQLVKKGLVMGLKDAQIAFLMQDMSDMSMMATPSMLINNINRSLDCLSMFAAGETQEGMEKMMGFTAATRGGLAGYKYLTEDEE